MNFSNKPPNLHDIPGGIEALGDFYTSRSYAIVSQAKSMVDAVVGLQELSGQLFEEYSQLYGSGITEMNTSLIPASIQAGITYISAVRKIIPYTRENFGKEVIIDIREIAGVKRNPTLAIWIRYIRMHTKIFLSLNKSKLIKPITGYADPEVLFQEQRSLYARNICLRLGESLVTGNFFIRHYPDILTEIEAAIWHEMIFINRIMNKEGYFTGRGFLPFNYPEETDDLPGEFKLKRLLSRYEDIYYAQFEIDNKKTKQIKSVFK